ncbi:MAG TPA: MBL fold metallo-hydrolase [Oligoflexia bacterium]|nr:MBL fold metallo-hydrolase [Oligoflexia bacterium]HMP49835.1 MBL fold metallo-hydrolase [Oligoflexia bacterium]
MLKISTLTITHFSQNCRVLIDSESHSLLVIDPGGEVSRILLMISHELNASNGFSPEKIDIVLTHAHIDHGGGVKDLSEKLEQQYSLKPRLLFHSDCNLYRETIEQQVAFFRLPPNEYHNVPDADEYLEDGDSVSLGEYSFQVLFTPGHAPGHISLYGESLKCTEIIWDQVGSSSLINQIDGPVLIAGDTLFLGSIGRTDLPGGDLKTLLVSISEKLLTLPDETQVLSGHGPNTTIGKERRNNPFLRNLSGHEEITDDF